MCGGICDGRHTEIGKLDLQVIGEEKISLEIAKSAEARCSRLKSCSIHHEDRHEPDPPNEDIRYLARPDEAKNCGQKRIVGKKLSAYPLVDHLLVGFGTKPTVSSSSAHKLPHTTVLHPRHDHTDRVREHVV